MRTKPLVVLALAASLLLVACGGGDGSGAPAPTTTPVPEASPVTAAPSTTQPPPPPTAPVSRLTGLPLIDQWVQARPVVAVKFDNAHGKSTPQFGIGDAEVVYEVPVEGQVTRFLALYQSIDTGPIGPIRSARGSEIGLLEELHSPLFTWHGANGILAAQVRGSSIIPRSIDDIPHLFYRERSRRAPYNSFAVGTAEIRATAPPDATGPDRPILRFAAPGEAVPSKNALPATSVRIVFPPAFGGASGRGGAVPVRFEWDGRRWVRFQAERPHIDADGGGQIGVENVIVRFTPAVDSGTVDQAGSRVPTAQVTGEGEAWIFSNGRVATGTWHKPDNATPATYRDVEGNEIVLTPGKTWIALPYGPGSSFG